MEELSKDPTCQLVKYLVQKLSQEVYDCDTSEEGPVSQALFPYAPHLKDCLYGNK